MLIKTINSPSMAGWSQLKCLNLANVGVKTDVLVLWLQYVRKNSNQSPSKALPNVKRKLQNNYRPDWWWIQEKISLIFFSPIHHNIGVKKTTQEKKKGIQEFEEHSNLDWVHFFSFDYRLGPDLSVPVTEGPQVANSLLLPSARNIYCSVIVKVS